PALHAAVGRARATRNGTATLADAYAELPAELRHINSIRGLVLAARSTDQAFDATRTQTLRFTQINGTERTARLPLVTFTKDTAP
ncbi:DUF3375 domain-containing protein, partial [Arthrobacter sp. A2-55]